MVQLFLMTAVSHLNLVYLHKTRRSGRWVKTANLKAKNLRPVFPDCPRWYHYWIQVSATISDDKNKDARKKFAILNF